MAGLRVIHYEPRVKASVIALIFAIIVAAIVCSPFADVPTVWKTFTAVDVDYLAQRE